MRINHLSFRFVPAGPINCAPTRLKRKFLATCRGVIHHARGTACSVQRLAVLRSPPRTPVVPLGARPPPVVEAGLWGGAKDRPCQRPIPLAAHLPLLPETSHGNLKFLTRTPLTRSPCPDYLTLPVPCYSGPVRAPAFRERQTGAPRPGFESSPMAFVGEPINRPRYTGQRDRSQTVLAAPRDTKGAAPHQAAPGTPLAGRPGYRQKPPRNGR